MIQLRSTEVVFTQNGSCRDYECGICLVCCSWCALWEYGSSSNKAHKLLDFISIIVVNTFIGALFNLVLFNIIEPNILKVFLASFAYSIFMWDWIVDYKW